MANPWLKKNPFMSLWLSGANKVAGSLRGHASARARRQTTTAMTAAAVETAELWANALGPPSTVRRKPRRK